MSDTTPKFGELITGEAFRDAVHIAVCPVIANEILDPGDFIELTGDIKDGVYSVVEAEKKGIGIVDPYLATPVSIGEKFWMFLHQKSITSLRHHWTHPAFTEIENKIAEDEEDDGCKGCFPRPKTINN